MATWYVVESLFYGLLALFCFPLSAPLLILNYLYISIFPLTPVHKRLRETPGFQSRTILITGIDTPQGLRLARTFHRTGHLVIGADHEPQGLPSQARFSKALSRFYRLAYEIGESHEATYIVNLVRIIQQEHADLWINCSSSMDFTIEAHARDAVEQNTSCRCFALRPNDSLNLANREGFMKYLASQGLPVPESHQVTSRAEIHNILSRARGGRKYLLQSLEPNGVDANTARTTLPSRTISQTYDAVARISIANITPWRLEQDINGLERYFTFAIAVRGSLQAFVAGHAVQSGCYQALEPESALSHAMLRFVHALVRRQGSDFTSHFGIEFCGDVQAAESGVVQAILPVQVSVRAQAAILLFHGMSGSIQLTRAYLSVFALDQDVANKKGPKPALAIIQQQTQPEDVAVPGTKIPGTYCFGQLLVNLLFEPLHALITRRSSLIQCGQQIILLLGHLMFWEDDTYDFQDPLPFWLLYQVYVPLRLIKSALFPAPNQP